MSDLKGTTLVVVVLATLSAVGVLLLWNGLSETQEDLARLADSSRESQDDLRRDLESRITGITFHLARGPYGCDATPPRCNEEEGWLDTSAVLYNTYPGGRCGQGDIYRLCMRVRDD